MFVIKRNQIIIAALVIMIAVAGYLNYADRKTESEYVYNGEDGFLEALVPNEESVAMEYSDDYDAEFDEIGIALSDEGDLLNITAEQKIQKEDTQNKNETPKDNVTQTTDNETEDSGTAVFVNATNESTYFIQAKLDREQARSKEREILTELINNKNLDKEQRSKSADAMLDIQKRIEKETAAEAMIESKGFSEVYVRIDDQTVDVVVNKEELSEAELAQIEDIVKRKTGIKSDNIRISPLKK